MNNIKFISKEDSINNLIIELENDKKRYLRINEFLNTIGNFTEEVELELYEAIDRRNLQEIRLCFSDKDDNIYIICPISSKKENKYLIEVMDDFGERKYNILLLKKEPITKENIELARTKEEYNFNFGRLITDNKNFFNLFLGNNICYQLKTNSKEEQMLHPGVLVDLNSMKERPTLLEYINIIQENIERYGTDMNIDEVNSYDNFNKESTLSFSNKQQNKVLKKG